MRRVLVANRGEIALRAIRACRQLGHQSLAVFSSADANSPHRWAADHAICIGPPPATASYLNVAALLETATAMKCDAVYPGYGFLAENSAFVERCCEAGLTFIGPDGECIARMGDKVAARQAAAAIGIPVVPGSKQGFTSRCACPRCCGRSRVSAAAEGKRWRRRPRHARCDARPKTLPRNSSRLRLRPKRRLETRKSISSGFSRRFAISRIQVFGDHHGNHVHLGERDCSVQRRHQKLVEESPSPALDQPTRVRMAEAAVALIKSLNYVNAGTVEFIFDPASGKFFFIEMNTRIQVEHPVTEMVTGTDLVVEQFRVAAGEKLSFGSTFSEGRTAIEFRINAEDAARDFRPSPGLLKRWRPPSGRDIRIDSHVYENYAVPPYYDFHVGQAHCHGARSRGGGGGGQVGIGSLSGVGARDYRPVPCAASAAARICARRGPYTVGRRKPAGGDALMGDKRTINLVDVTLRDAHQCLWATRMTTAMMEDLAPRLDRAGFEAIDLVGGAVFDVCVRYLREDPWERMRILSGWVKQTPLIVMTRGQSLFTFEFFPDDIVELTAERIFRQWHPLSHAL